MADQQAPEPQETPAAAGPEGTGAAEQAEVDWQERYSHLQPEYTRSTQRVKELEDREAWYQVALTSDDPDTQRQALEALGYTFDAGQEEPEIEEPAEYEDPYLDLLNRQELFEQRLNEREQAEREAEDVAVIRAIADDQLAQLEGLDEEDQNWVLERATNLPPLYEPNTRFDDGRPVPIPDIQSAFEAFQAWEVERQKKWAKTKRAPYVSPGGQEATEAPDFDSHQGRVEWAVRQLQQTETEPT